MKRALDILPILFMGLLFVLIDLSAFLVAGPFEAAGVVAFMNPSDPRARANDVCSLSNSLACHH
jgi:hypothetical protein